MNSGSLGYLTKEGFRNVYTNRLMSIASISVLFSCLVLIGSAFLLFVNMNAMVGSVEDQNVIMVFVKDEATSLQTESLGEQIKDLSNVKSCVFVPKDEAFQQQLKDLGSEADLFNGLQKNPLPDAYKVTLKDMTSFKDTVSKIQKLDNVLRVRENSDLASKLTTIRHTISVVSTAIIVLLLFVSLFIIANTIKVTMFNRRLEISIMKSVGATSWFIRWPFMLEGMILGALSGILALFAVWGVYSFAVHSLSSLLGDIGAGSALPFGRYAAVMLLGFIVIGVVAGAGGSTFSISKYLKEQEFANYEEKN